MSTRATSAVAVLAVLLAGCSPETAPAPEGVGPASSPRTSATERPTLELARPDPPAAAAPVPAPEPATPPQPAVIGPDIADLGPFDVLGWDEAKARAGQQIQPGNADAELEKLRVELENRP